MKTNTITNIIIVLLSSVAFSLMLYHAIPHGLPSIFCAICTIITGILLFRAVNSYNSI